MTRKPRDIAVSVRQRLLNIARKEERNFQMLLLRYAAERLLYRLSRSRYGRQFTLKGAMVFPTLARAPRRTTRDLDLLGTGAPQAARLEAMFRELCEIEVEDDGLVFSASSVEAEDIREEQAYGGVRVNLLADLAKARIPLQVDIGFGDVVTPEAREGDFEALLDFPRARVRAYPAETVVSEKFLAMVTLGMPNSRMRDFYDLWALSTAMSFDMELLSRAIKATFRNRDVPIPAESPAALTTGFAEDRTKLTQWRAFLRRTDLDPMPPAFGEVVSHLGRFLGPVIELLRAGTPPRGTWPPGGPWGG